MSEKIRVGVSGFLGRMGTEVVRAVEGAPDMTMVGGADPAWSPEACDGAIFTASVGDMLSLARPDVVVDFSVPSSVMENASEVLRAGVHCVIGTTGLLPDQREELGRLALANGVGVLVAPNFAMGAVLMMQFARQAARHFQGVEIIELHHEKKLDAPSGTALMTAELVSREWSLSETSSGGAQPARGDHSSGVHIHSVRMPGYVAHQEVLLGNPGETLTIRHDSSDRKSFMPGVLLGIRSIRGRTGLVFGLEHFILE